ncbi:hypothetical protein GGR52DRAFT_77669 [Hypoxylon sp. FL1284]|nr:hypothetical protein GGR52DRAFT_77669 [Hypoxylon sp. FL1284]
MSSMDDDVYGAIIGIEKILRVYGKYEEVATDLPDAFRGVANAVPSAKAVLNDLLDKVDDMPNDDALTAAATTIYTKATSLYHLFNSVLPPGNGTRSARYNAAARKRGAVEILAKEMMESILEVSKDVAEPESIQELEKQLQEVSKIPLSFEGGDGSRNEFNNWGDGHQNNNTGSGTQHINTGNAPQFSGRFETFNMGAQGRGSNGE